MSSHHVPILTLIGLLASTVASAQSGFPVVSGTADTNPYTGQPLMLEHLTRELETAKVQTAVLEERVKQAQLNMTLNVVPAKERAELKQLEMQAQQAARSASVEASAPTPAPKVAPKKVEAPTPPPAPVVQLASVINVNGVKAALLDVDGQSLAVRDGDTTRFGRVVILDDRRIQLGARELAVHDLTLSRLTISDPKPVKEGEQVRAGVSSPIIIPPPMPTPSSR